jgi:hypothetical protein
MSVLLAPASSATKLMHNLVATLTVSLTGVESRNYPMVHHGDHRPSDYAKLDMSDQFSEYQSIGVSDF